MSTESPHIDELSGVYNRRYLKEKQEAEIATYVQHSMPYYPIREALNYRINRLGLDIVKVLPSVYKLELSKLIPEIAEEIEEPEGVEAVMDKYRLYESIRKVIEIGSIPKVFVVDNIQWIDKESVEVLRYLVRTLKEHAITFIFVFRTEEMTDFLGDFIASLSREVPVTDIPVEPLPLSEAKKGVQAIIGEEPKQSLVDFVYRESGGIPFYIEEILRGLVDKRFLAVEQDTWVFREPDEEVVPKRLEESSEGVTNEDTKAGLYLLFGRYYSAIGDFEQADSRLHAALMLYETLGDWLATGRAHYHIGVAELKKGNKEKCKEHTQKALDIFSFIKTKSWKEKAEAIIKECASA